MKFTWRVALETLRLVPPVFGNFRRAIEDTEFDGYLIPKGWQVFLVASVTHMDDAIFHEPAKFDPSRFKDQPSSATAPPCSFVAFGGGPRICIGMEFARIETLVTMHYLRQGPHADAAARPAHRAREQVLSLIRTKIIGTWHREFAQHG